MARKRSECEMKKVGFLYIPQWKPAKYAVAPKEEPKRKHRKA